MDAPTAKDVMTAVLSAAAALAGLLLIFLGVVISIRQSYAADTPPTVLTKYQMAGWATLVVGGFSLATVLLALFWMLSGAGVADGVYRAALAAFFAQLAGIAAIALYVTKKALS